MLNSGDLCYLQVSNVTGNTCCVSTAQINNSSQGQGPDGTLACCCRMLGVGGVEWES